MSLKRNVFLRLLALLVVFTAALSGVAAGAAAKDKKDKKKDKAAQEQVQTTSSKVDLNSASEKDLDSLPGVGPATSQKIISNRPYSSVDDLNKAGVPQSTIEKIRPMVTASAAASSGAPSGKRTEKSSSEKAEGNVSNVDLNSASQKDLEALPGVGPATAKKIIAGRPYTSVDDLSKAGVSAKTIDKIRSQVTVSSTNPAQPAGSAGTGKSSNSTSTPSSNEEASKLPQSDNASAAPASGSGMVWVNLDTKVYHHEGDRWYGKTKHGKYMTEADAEKAGYRAAKTGKGKE